MTTQNLRRREIVARTVSIPEALAEIPGGATIFVGTGAAEPAVLVDPVLDLAVERNWHLLFGYSLREAPRGDFRVPVASYFHVGRRQKAAFEKGIVDWIPTSFADIPELFRPGHIQVDAAIIQVSPSDQHGQFSLGVSVDITRAAVESARIVIAQINPYMPRTHGNSFLDYRKIHRFIQRGEPLAELAPRESSSPVEEEIARNVCSLIPDGSTLQLGFARIPRHLLSRMSEKKDLGIHSLLVSDWVMELLDNGTVTNNRKTWFPGKVVTSFALGSRRFYEYLNDSPVFEFLTADVVANPRNIRKNHQFISIMDAERMDLSGRFSSEESGFARRLGTFLTAGQLRASNARSILVLPSRNRKREPNILLELGSEHAVSGINSQVDRVVTEYGVAELWGCSLQKRALRLIPLMHPEDRQELWSFARNRRWFCEGFSVRPPEPAQTVHRISGPRELQVQTASVQDFDRILRFFHSMSESDRALRFFHHEVRLDDYVLGVLNNPRAVVFLAIRPMESGNRLLGVAECVRDPQAGGSQIALVTSGACRRQGIGRAMVQGMQNWACLQEQSALFAEVLASNTPMVQLLSACGWKSVAGSGSVQFLWCPEPGEDK